MARVNDTYRQGALASLADTETAFNAWIAAVQARVNVLTGGTNETNLTLTASFNITAENAAGDEFTHKLSFSYDSGTLAAGTPEDRLVTLVVAWEVFAQAIVTASDYDSVTAVSVSATVTMNG